MPNPKIRGRPPAAVEITVPAGHPETQFIYIAQIALLAPEPFEGYRDSLREAARKYLLASGNSRELIDVCKKAIELHINSTEASVVEPSKRAGADRAAEFERRLDAYESTEPHPVRTIEALCEILRRMGSVGTEARTNPLEPSGRRQGTSAKALAVAITQLPDQAARSECVARFEALAHQLWGWQYPRLTDELRTRIIDDFRAHHSPAATSAPNVTIRMLWHFDRVGVPYSLDMFRLPEGNDSWQKNLARLGALGTWDPRRAKS